MSPASEKVTGNTDIDLPPTSNSSALKIICQINSVLRLDDCFICFFVVVFRFDSCNFTFAVFSVSSRKIFQSEQKRSSCRLQPGAKEEMINKNILKQGV